MSAKDLRGKEPGDLQAEVIKLRREQFSLRMQAASGQTVKSSDFGKVKKSIARVKTVMREQALKKTGLTAAAGAKK
jgi:large subunit ribosomal protein L29